MKKAVIIGFLKNKLELSNQKSISKLLFLLGYEVEIVNIKEFSKLENVKGSDYDLISLLSTSNGLWVSGKGYSHFFKEFLSTADKNSILIFNDDTSLPIRLKGIKEKDGSINHLLDNHKVKVVTSINKEILENKDLSKKLLHKWMKETPAGSKWYSALWVVGYYLNKEEHKAEIEAILSTVNTDIEYPKNIRYLYYGYDKPLRKHLKNLGFGEKEDFAYGTISKTFPNVQTMVFPKGEENGVPHWINIAKNSERVIIPYDEGKSEHQITLRYLESIWYYKDKVLIDSKIPENMRKFILTEKAWEEEINKVLLELKEIIEEEI